MDSNEWPVAFDYDDISLVPRQASELLHRSEASPQVVVGLAVLQVPLVGSPMPDVCGEEMCLALAKLGSLGILHRFWSLGEQVQAYKSAKEKAQGGVIGTALGVTGDYDKRLDCLYEAGCRIFCLDTANGAHKQVSIALKKVISMFPDIFVIAGNVASGEAFSWLEDLGADGIRVGIAGGSVCETKTETGVFTPTPYAVYEAASVRKGKTLIIGDSGVRNPSDMCKLLALGADLVMVGSALAGTGEAPGRVIMVDGKKYKIMRGAASFSVQQDVKEEGPEYVEGSETMVAYKGHVSGVISRYLAGLRSSMSYMNARDLDTYRKNVSVVKLK